MNSLRIILEGDGAFPELAEARAKGELIHLSNGAEIAVTALEGGMTSGRASVGFCFRLPDGRWVFAETSLRLFLAAAAALRARYGDQE